MKVKSSAGCFVDRIPDSALSRHLSACCASRTVRPVESIRFPEELAGGIVREYCSVNSLAGFEEIICWVEVVEKNYVWEENRVESERTKSEILMLGAAAEQPLEGDNTPRVPRGASPLKRSVTQLNGDEL